MTWVSITTWIVSANHFFASAAMFLFVALLVNNCMTGGCRDV